MSEPEQRYVHDEPWRPGESERLGRRGFANRIATTIGARQDRAGLVIALYGPWGEGKTSVLHMVREDLRRFSDVVIVDFNPWLFKDADHLVSMFFETLAKRLGDAIQLRTGGENLGTLLRRYGRVLKGVPMIGGVAGEVAEAAGERLGEPALDELRQRVEDGIRSSGAHVVVFVDDIDRLDSTEVRAVMRLVKLTAGFESTTYVLAFDHRVVSAALVAATGGGESADGQRYLEKIVQVPLQLPLADPATLFSLALEHLNASIGGVEADFPESDQQAFLRYLQPLYDARRRTVREGKRYANAVGFALPLLAGEAHTGDLLLLEALRTWYPEVHARVYRQRDLFVGDALGRPPLDRDGGMRANAATAQWVSVIEGLDSREEKAVKETLEYLFPFVQAVTRNTHHGSEWISIWDKKQRAASTNYFDRYFQYAVPQSDVADRTVLSIERLLASGDTSGVAEEIRAQSHRGAGRRLLEKLSLREEALPPMGARHLARAIAASGDAFKDEGGFLGGWFSSEAAAARVIRRCIARLPRDERAVLALEFVEHDASLRFATAIYQWLRAMGSQRVEDTAPLTEPEEESLRVALGRRLDNEYMRQPLFQKEPLTDRRKLLEWWAISTSESNTRSKLGADLQADPQNVLALLVPFQSHGWMMESGLATPDEISDHDYEALSRIADPVDVLTALKNVFGNDLETFDPHEDRSFATDQERVAYQFAYQQRMSSARRDRNTAVAQEERGDESTPTA